MCRLLPRGANIDVFRQELEKTLDLNLEILLPEDIEDAHAIFLNKVHAAALCAAPVHQLQCSQKSLPRTIETLLLIKRRLRRQHCRTRDPIVYRALTIHYGIWLKNISSRWSRNFQLESLTDLGPDPQKKEQRHLQRI
ncbi:hypothetical protein ACLKA6_003298 [Drosophila palustris]